MTELFERLERFYDAVPRDGAHTEDFGGLVLFVRDGPGWPFYARPRLGAHEPPSAADITSVRARQRAIGAPEAFEWVHEVTPDLLAVARSAGLAVLEAPLLVLDPSALVTPPGADVRFLDPATPSFATDVAVRRAVGAVGFGSPGTSTGPAGPEDRDAAVLPVTAAELADERRMMEAGRRASVLGYLSPPAADPELAGVLASGILQRVDDVAEIAGVAVLPTARRRGLGAAVTAALARHALDTGVDLVFLSAGSDDIARVYARVGFKRVGTACIATPSLFPTA
ncbi:GNAT family N-acetyltransferase [Phytohabitans sp. ZYX-F-186]|uniref:GNAT family N-acetyltransferase n=1 Tax=Phytohabitans maris TaxID=3071409 RepID=A0ABU0ZC12_9ACTN|nr:GNAT family N-acetyltransferase [Phytohabitans sp. ZYX-F-186]MDQ7904585.1 GNAT family N-acetyltransferase [Phytohabitans sp. ZYX-F-186]